jgi:hypothetical protein
MTAICCLRNAHADEIRVLTAIIRNASEAAVGFL